MMTDTEWNTARACAIAEERRRHDVREFWRIILTTAAVLAATLIILALTGGCAYRGGKVVDGTNIAIGMTIPGTEWTINALDYVAGVRVAGNDATRISVSNEVAETNSYFGCITTTRRTRMTAAIEPVETAAEDAAADAAATDAK